MVEEATLERWYTGNGIVGSNPTFSAAKKPLSIKLKAAFIQNGKLFYFTSIIFLTSRNPSVCIVQKYVPDASPEPSKSAL